MNHNERLKLVNEAIEKFGWDFFMVDGRNTSVKAAPFHIGCAQDAEVFAEYGSHLIPWQASTSGTTQIKREGGAA